MAVTATFIVVRVTSTIAFAVALKIAITHAVGKSQAEMSFEMSFVGKIVRPVVVRQDIGYDCQVIRHVVIDRSSITRSRRACSVNR